jgi:hypothetical protein
MLPKQPPGALLLRSGSQRFYGTRIVVAGDPRHDIGHLVVEAALRDLLHGFHDRCALWGSVEQ